LAKNLAKQKRGAGKLPKLLLPVDGSTFSERALGYVIDYIKRQGPVKLHLLSVQAPMDPGKARMFGSTDEAEAYQRDEGLKLLKPYLERLDAEGIVYADHVRIGPVSRTIARFAKKRRFDRVIMGTHGRSGMTHLLLGSVAQNVVRRLKIPVALVK
jgi:nucleotide-binding universal stress UspA family protein